MYYILAFFLLGACVWRSTPLSVDHDDWLDIIVSLCKFYLWLMVLVLGVFMVTLGMKS